MLYRRDNLAPKKFKKIFFLNEAMFSETRSLLKKCYLDKFMIAILRHEMLYRHLLINAMFHKTSRKQIRNVGINLEHNLLD